jgi:hypothetical protein
MAERIAVDDENLNELGAAAIGGNCEKIAHDDQATNFSSRSPVG